MLRLIVGSCSIASGEMLVAAPERDGVNTADAASARTSIVSLTACSCNCTGMFVVSPSFATTPVCANGLNP
jgi:hypothetical protein